MRFIFVITCHNVFNVQSKTTLLPVCLRDAKRLDIPEYILALPGKDASPMSPHYAVEVPLASKLSLIPAIPKAISAAFSQQKTQPYTHCVQILMHAHMYIHAQAKKEEVTQCPQADPPVTGPPLGVHCVSLPQLSTIPGRELTIILSILHVKTERNALFHILLLQSGQTHGTTLLSWTPISGCSCGSTQPSLGLEDGTGRNTDHYN